MCVCAIKLWVVGFGMFQCLLYAFTVLVHLVSFSLMLNVYGFVVVVGNVQHHELVTF